VVDSLGPATTNGTTADGHDLVTALASHDVVVCLNNTQFSSLFTTADRAAFLAWAHEKGHGVVAMHGATDDNDTWQDKVTYFGGKFTTHTTAPVDVYSDSTPSTVADEGFKAINAGISKVTKVTDEWYSFQSAPRNLAGIKVLSTLDEKSYTPDSRMGDHPISWYRNPADGGRLYYTAAGHDWVYFRDTYWLRRQLYNGILWASGWTPGVSIDAKAPITGEFGTAKALGSTIVVNITRDGSHSVAIADLQGKRIAAQRGMGGRVYAFNGLKPNTVYAVLVSTPKENIRRIVTTR
jgi:type 1 glutamine amidotransferase